VVSVVNHVGALHASTLADDCIVRNEWLCWDYVTTRREDILEFLGEHVYITVTAMIVSIVVALALVLIVRRFRRLRAFMLGASTALYTIPSLAMFSLLVPFTRLTATTVIIGLVLYSLTILVRGFLIALEGVDADVREAATGMGFGPQALLWRVQVPLALPAMFAAIRVATVSTVALTTVGVVVGHGGLGQLIGRGRTSNFHPEVLTGAVLCVVLAVLADLALLALQKWATPWRRMAVTV
jgi:osmoprotectant transport system permease protein